jgi:hypothetical protein
VSALLRRGRTGLIAAGLATLAAVVGIAVAPGTANATTIGSTIWMPSSGRTPTTMAMGNSIDLGGRQLILQSSDGNLVLYNNTVHPAKRCWASNKFADTSKGAPILKWQNDGNLVEYFGSQVVWASNRDAGIPFQSSGTTVDIELNNGKYNFWIGTFLTSANC